MSSDPRLEPLEPDQLTEAQRELYDAVLASPRGQGPLRRMILREDGSLSGPFDAFLRTPGLGLHLERLGNAFRSETSYPVTAREVAILVVARGWSADFEWWAHAMMARNGGVPEDVIEVIAQDRKPAFDEIDSPEREAMRSAHEIAHQLVHRRALDRDALDRAKQALGERGTVELVLLVGFYQLISGVLESFQPPAPADDLPVVGPPPIPERAGIDLYTAASTTRAVRRLRVDPVPDEILARVFRAATWAPSGANQQPWRIMAIRAPEPKAALAKLYAEEWAEYAKNARARIASLPDTVPEAMRGTLERSVAAGDHLAAHLAETPVLAVFCFDPNALHVSDVDQGRTAVVGGASLYPAVQNLLLACRAEGLGCVLTTLLGGRDREVCDVLDIPEPWATHAMVPIGWPVGRGHGPLSRRPVEEAVFGDRFGEPFLGDPEA